ncbi:DUF5947 family protein [Streptomyces sp. CAU 1734]|uniref:DUF5947 family protein n=1 Tax=Streptomyces sp. CAU 1734 TaxID=3140360 RepID=UPI0032618846
MSTRVPGTAPGPRPSPVRTLRRFTEPRPPRPERCELCGVPVAEGNHRHLADTEQRSLACACVPCALLFARSGAAGGRFRAIPDRWLTDPGHRFDQGAWELLRIPVGLAFVFHNTALDRLVALYPGPAGATEHELDDTARRTVLDAGPLAALLEPDVEALLLHRHEGRTECHLVPIDSCYELVGRLRLSWQGFDGGTGARAELRSYFAHIARRARTVSGTDTA